MLSNILLLLSLLYYYHKALRFDLKQAFSVLGGAKSFTGSCYFSVSFPSFLSSVKCLLGRSFPDLEYWWFTLCRRTYSAIWFGGYLPGSGESAGSFWGLLYVCIMAMTDRNTKLPWLTGHAALLLPLTLASFTHSF